MSLWFWAWPCIPLFRYTGVNRAALLPQGRFKLLLVRNSSLPHTLFIWGAQRKAGRGTLPRTMQAGLGVPAAPGRCRSPSPCPGWRAAGHCRPARLAPGQRQRGQEGTRPLVPAESCLQFTCLEAAREEFRVDPWKSLAWRMAALRFPGWERYDFARKQQLWWGFF